MGITVAGIGGEIRWAYHLASRVSDWTITKPVDGLMELRATLVNPDTMRLSQQPLVFVAMPAKGRWPITSTLQIAGASCIGTLGPVEGVSHVVSGRQT